MNLKELYVDADNNTPLEELVDGLKAIQEKFPIPLRLCAYVEIVVEPIPKWEQKEADND